MRAGCSSWPSWRSPRGPRVAGFSSLGLLLAIAILFLLISPLSAQSSPPISPLGPSDYQSFRADWATVSAQLENYESSYRQALNVNASISAELKQARAELQTYRDSSTQSYLDLLQRVTTLELQLSDSDALVSELRSSLESKRAEYQAKLQEAQEAAAGLERSRSLWRGGAIAGWIVAIILGLLAAFR